MATEKPAAPKFASFKPTKPLDSPSRSPKLKSSKSATVASHGRDGLPEELELSRRDTRRRTGAGVRADRSNDRSWVKEPEPTPKDAAEHITIPGTFTIDKKGDTDNVRYGYLHSYAVPRYSRHGYGNVIGLGNTDLLDRANSTEKDVSIMSSRSTTSSAKRDKTLWRRSQAKGVEESIQPQVSSARLDELSANFLPLSTHLGKKRRRSSVSTSSESEDLGDGAGEEDREAAGLNPSAQVRFEHERILGSQRNKHVELSRAVQASPGNGAAWLRLIDHQYQLMGLGETGPRSRTTAAEMRSTAEVKMSMYEKALSSVKDTPSRELLSLGMLRCGSQLWDTRQQASRWQDVLQEHPTSQALWTAYLNFHQTSAAIFDYEDMKDSFVSCLSILSKAPASIGVLEARCYVTLRATLCMYEAGFPEQANAIWQALLDFNLYRSVVEDDANLMSAFENFWDSEAPRLGEEGGLGWTNLATDQEIGAHPDIDLNSEPKVNLHSWYGVEDEIALRRQYPIRTYTDVAGNDPYRVILFSDIEDFLFEIPSEEQQILLNAFLAYKRLPPLMTATPTLRNWWLDSFVRNYSRIASDTQEPIVCDSSNGGKQGRSHLLNNCLTTPDTLVGSRTTDGFSMRSIWPSDVPQADLSYLETLFKTLTDSGIGGEDLAEYRAAFVLEYLPAKAKKITRGLLKHNPGCLHLYCAYAKIQALTGDVPGACSTLETAIQMSRALDSDRQVDAVFLWETLTWIHLEHGTKDMALAVLLRFGQASTMDCLNDAIAKTNWLRASVCVGSLATLAYLSDPAPLDAALEVFHASILRCENVFPTESFVHEAIHQNRAKLIHFHITKTKVFKPATVRKVLLQSIEAFPSNTIFLSLYAENEKRFRIDDRLRTIVEDVLFSNGADGRLESVVIHSFNIQNEMGRGITFGSNQHSIRAAFERAVSRDSGKNSTRLWKEYFQFELGLTEYRRAKEVFYRAINACPWVKTFYLLPFAHLQEHMSVEELHGVYSSMVVKGLRLHVSLEDVFTELLPQSRSR